MKVIVELIRHFWQRGALTPLEVDYLLRHDFVREGDLPGYHRPKGSLLAPVGAPEGIPVDPPGWLDTVEEQLVRRKPAHRRSGSNERSDQLKIADLCDRLQQEFTRRSRDLESVRALGERFFNVGDWQEAASELRNVTPQRFYRGLCAELREGDVLLGDIWQASDPEPFHRLIEDDETHGRAARSFLALLVAAGPDELGKYSWVLKYKEMQAVINLRVLHRRLLESLSRIQQRDRQLLTHALARNSDPIQTWSLVILYNAYRKPRLFDQPQYGKEYGPVPKPNFDIWRDAWTAALRMDRKHVTELLVAYYKDAPVVDRGLDSYVGAGYLTDRSLMCPTGWRLP